jgi:N-acetylmuramate 1-kinase
MRHRAQPGLAPGAAGASHGPPARKKPPKKHLTWYAVTAPITWSDPTRQAAFNAWLAGIAPQHALQPHTLVPASADASFRRYFRLQGTTPAGPGTLVVMDAPPAFENVRPFQHVAGLLQAAGLQAPLVLQADAEQGFLLLTDLGSQLYLQALQDAQTRADAAQADALMRAATQALVHFQQHVPATDLPAFDEALLRTELELFPQWCVQREFGIEWTSKQQATWDRTCALLVQNALAQPQLAVHADWMPRNLMLLPQQAGAHSTHSPHSTVGILDFQDAVCGPITYDMASLLRDAFISWPEEQELDWAVRGWQAARAAGLPVHADFGEHWRQLEWTGLQRHLKVLGIFCRLKHRDGKDRYAQDLPRFFAYATKVALRYGPLKPLLALLEPMSGAALAKGYTF